MGDFLFKFVEVLICFLLKYFVDFEIINFVWYGCNLKKNVNKNWCIWLWFFSRYCGRLLCFKCLVKDMFIIKYNLFKFVRVCEMCFDVLSFGGTF